MNINTAIADRARTNEALTPAELDELASADILSLGMLADEVRRARVGDTVTFVRVVDSAEGGNASPASEVRIAALPATLAAAIATVQAAAAGGRPVSGFSLADLVDRNWGNLADVLRQLKQAGLGAIVEAPLDLLEHAEAALQACQDAGLTVQCLSLQKPNAGERTAMLMRARALAARFPWLTTIAPLSREQSVTVPTTGYDDVRAVALARLALPGVPNVQVDWAQYGPKLAQVALTFGANDLDRVSTIDDESLGRRRTSVEDVTRNIEAAGFRPRERTLGA
ncbi:MAG: hypothetical protein AB7P34_17670 [Vicinamibacterales bacterium]